MIQSLAKSMICIQIRDESDIVMARKHARALAMAIGLPSNSAEALATAVTEVARNVLVHAWSGELRMEALDEYDRLGIVVVATDSGPGIADLKQAMEDGYSSIKSLGCGLSGAERLMDEFAIVSTVGKGTIVTMKKWTKNYPVRADGLNPVRSEAGSDQRD